MFSDHVYGTAVRGEYYACKVTGASHLRSETPCQDAYEAVSVTTETGEITFLAVADGHGSDKHDLSDHGSRLAVKAAVEIMRELYRKFGSIPRELARSFKQDMPRLVVRQWQREIKEDAVLRNIAVPDDIEGLQGLFSRYGTTLLAAICLPDAVLFGQIGDGNIVYVDPNGFVELPFAQQSDEMIGNVTYSMSSEQAHLLWATSIRTVEAKPAIFYMCTDGLANSFDSDESFQSFSRSLMENIREKTLSGLRDHLPPIFQDYTARGSGDDISIAIHYYT